MAYLNVLCLLVISLLTKTNCNSDGLFPRENENFKNTYTIFRQNMTASLKTGEKLKGSTTSIKEKIPYLPLVTSPSGKHFPKWQVGRITQKQYEIINVLWRKTKIFVNLMHNNDYTTSLSKGDNVTKMPFKRYLDTNSIIFSPAATVSQTSAPSNIEFYYLDGTDDREKQKDCVFPNCQRSKENSYNSDKAKETNTSFHGFDIKWPFMRRQSTKWSTSSQNNPLTNRHAKISGIKIYKPQKVNLHTKAGVYSTANDLRYKRIDKAITELSYHDETCPVTTTEILLTLNKRSDDENNREVTKTKLYNTDTSTVYDKIKFFEIYDQFTETPYSKKANLNDVGFDEHINEQNKINNNQKILLEHVDLNSHQHGLAKHSKKHITESFQNSNKSCNKKSFLENMKPEMLLMNVTMEKEFNETSNITNRNQTKFVRSDYKIAFSYVSEAALWSKYPFTAVYVYEPSQVHCDAAGINAHWLVASGACLSRIDKNPFGEGRSAFVAYCGTQWWQPERVSYVKYSLVHPWYNSKDRTRRHLYNIGVIQVVTSMRSACSGWEPASMMSYQFAAETQGSTATAVGWGLDRFDTKYSSTEMPKIPLMIYKALLYFDSCPGNIGYSKSKRLDEGGGVKNVHCLLLPPYSGEENDPVHGGLLLVGGKLIALYLQEERRPWGEQSAQYTGIWKLIPWVMEVAKEPDEIESIDFEI